MAELCYDHVTDWRLCDRVTPDALRDELRACGCRFEMADTSERMLEAIAPPPPHDWSLLIPNGDALPGWRDAKVSSLSFVRHIRRFQTGREVTQWAVLRRLLWRSGDWLGLLWLAWHWLAMRTKRTDKDGPS